jgi:hypothetical protein
MIEARKYLDTKTDGLKIKLTISFNRSQTNWATNQPMAVGYRVTATPTTVEDKGDYTVESFSAFSGFGDTILECQRRSSKRLDKAIDLMIEKIPLYKKHFETKGIKF